MAYKRVAQVTVEAAVAAISRSVPIIFLQEGAREKTDRDYFGLFYPTQASLASRLHPKLPGILPKLREIV